MDKRTIYARLRELSRQGQAHGFDVANMQEQAALSVQLTAILKREEDSPDVALKRHARCIAERMGMQDELALWGAARFLAYAKATNDATPVAPLTSRERRRLKRAAERNGELVEHRYSAGPKRAPDPGKPVNRWPDRVERKLHNPLAKAPR